MLVQALALAIALQRRQVTRHRRPGQQRFGQGTGIAQGQVEPLPGNRVQAVGGIAEDRQVRTHLLFGFHQGQRVQVAGAHLLEGAQAIPEHTLQFAQEATLVEAGQALGVHADAGPDQRATVVRQRQQGHGAFIGKALERLAIVGFARGDVGDQRALVVGPGFHANAQLLTQAGTAAIGQYRKVAFQHGFIVEGQAIAIGQRLHARDFCRAAPAHHVLVQALPQALAEPGVFHHITQGWHALLHRGQTRGGEAPTVRYMDLLDRLRTPGNGLPQAQPLVNLARAKRQRGRARIVARLVAVARCKGFDQHDLPTPRLGPGLQCQGQAGAHQATADNRQVDPAHRAAAINASISATVLGTPPVRISQPCLVTTTSSSMRTPMPRHFFATVWLSGEI